jgi:hypothetical protein
MVNTYIYIKGGDFNVYSSLRMLKEGIGTRSTEKCQIIIKLGLAASHLELALNIKKLHGSTILI